MARCWGLEGAEEVHGGGSIIAISAIAHGPMVRRAAAEVGYCAGPADVPAGGARGGGGPEGTAPAIRTWLRMGSAWVPHGFRMGCPQRVPQGFRGGSEGVPQGGPQGFRRGSAGVHASTKVP